MILLTRPTRDAPDKVAIPYLQWWLQSSVNSCVSRTLPKHDLRGDRAVREDFEEAVEAEDPELIVGGGHGKEDMFTGQFTGLPPVGYSVLLTKDNAGLTEGKIVYLLSCLTAQELGPKCIESGARAFAGYDRSFAFMAGAKRYSPFDRYASEFSRPATMFGNAIIGGRTVEEAKKMTLDSFSERIDEWERRYKEADTDTEKFRAREMVKWLLHDKKHFRVLGDSSARAFEERSPALYPLRIAGLGGGMGLLAWLSTRGK